MGRNYIYWISIGAYIISRIALYLLGVRFVLMPEFMHFLDPALLRDSYFESIFYLHVFPPLMNAMLGAALNLFGNGTLTAFHLLFLLMGISLTASLTYLFQLLRPGPYLTIGLTALFMLSPPTIYFENFFFHTYPTAVLLVILAVLFHMALIRATYRRWLLFFMVAAVLCYLRSTMHLLWLVSLLLLAIVFQWKQRSLILRSAALPLLLVLILYTKNLAVFGFFGASSWMGNSLTKKTVHTQPEQVIERWVQEGTISELCRLSTFSAPDKYHSFFDLDTKKGIPVLDQQIKSNGYPNYNHWVIREVAEIHLQDGLHGLRKAPRHFLDHFWKTLQEHFHPTTRWHPRDNERSPHLENRKHIGAYERLYNWVFHGFPSPPLGMYIIIRILWIIAVLAALMKLIRKQAEPLDQLVLFCGFNSLFIIMVSSLLEYGEVERFRYLFEVHLWMLSVYAIQQVRSQIRSMRKAG